VSGSPTTFDAAGLDLAARIVTALVWVLAASLAAGGAIAFGSGARPAGVILILVGLSLVALHAWLRRMEPRSYVVEDGGLSILRRSASPRRFVGALQNPNRGALGWRVAGDGGGYGYLGRFRAEGRTVSAYVTDRARVVLLEVGATALAVSPDDPDDFVERLGHDA
jgi:PH (Pleckstrin Homology) domain-containing protein